MENQILKVGHDFRQDRITIQKNNNREEVGLSGQGDYHMVVYPDFHGNNKVKYYDDIEDAEEFFNAIVK